MQRVQVGGRSLLLPKEAESLLFVFFFVFLPLAGTGLAGYCHAGWQGLGTARSWGALCACGQLNFIRDRRGDGLNPCVHFLLKQTFVLRGRASRVQMSGTPIDRFCFVNVNLTEMENIHKMKRTR